ncbi:MAG: GNAT family N-acetyltransferase [Methylophilaceae bacterium]
MPDKNVLTVLINQAEFLDNFIRLNETWITHYFRLEEADRSLAGHPAKIIEDGGFIFTLLVNSEAVGVCALFKDDDHTFQLARMAVAQEHQGKGYGDVLMSAAIGKLHEIKARRVYLLSNTILVQAISLYQKHGFTTISEGQHPNYARCNIVMEKKLL